MDEVTEAIEKSVTHSRGGSYFIPDQVWVATDDLEGMSSAFGGLMSKLILNHPEFDFEASRPLRTVPGTLIQWYRNPAWKSESETSASEIMS